MKNLEDLIMLTKDKTSQENVLDPIQRKSQEKLKDTDETEKNLLIQLYIMIVRKTALAFQKIMPTNYYVYTETILKYDIFQETCCFVKS